MSERYVDEAFLAVVERLRAAEALLIVSHGRPDGDALGSIVALAASARAAGKVARVLVPDSPPPRYDYLFTDHACAEAKDFERLADDSDLIVILDTCAFSQLDGLEGALRARKQKIVVADHHATADDVGEICWKDTTAAAAGVMVFELLDALGWPVDLYVAEALVTAITTDTGWLRFANTDGRCLRVVARLVDSGVRPDKLYRRIYQTDRPERLELIQRVLQTLELHADGHLAAMTIREADFQDTGARPDETENLVNEALRLASVETAIMLVENTDFVRVSLRSRDRVDVSAVARRFGGGGHRRASGFRLAEDIDSLKDKVIAACIEAMAGRDP